MGRTKTFVREEVLDKAIQLFWEKGFADTSLSDLEKATGVNKSGLYSEFKDKDDLYTEAIKRYREIHPANSILTAEPLGWGNVETLLKSYMTCKGRKGCFFSNSVRENAIIPSKACKVISENTSDVRELLKKNLKAAGVIKDLDIMANIIMSFASGISIKLNAMKSEDLMEEVNTFLEMAKKF